MRKNERLEHSYFCTSMCHCRINVSRIESWDISSPPAQLHHSAIIGAGRQAMVFFAPANIRFYDGS
jgi:hypothetical protein